MYNSLCSNHKIGGWSDQGRGGGFSGGGLSLD